MVAAALEARCRPEVAVLHDRAMPGSRANIDHLAVAHSGVWVVDTKRYRGRIKVADPLFGSPKLTIGGRDRTSLVAGLSKQVEVVQRALADAGFGQGDAPVQGAFCFVQGELPVLRTLRIGGFPLLHRRSLPKRLNADGSLTVDRIVALTELLARVFPPR